MTNEETARKLRVVMLKIQALLLENELFLYCDQMREEIILESRDDPSGSIVFENPGEL